ncbi:Arabinosyltransferase [Arachis hypogaea]|nr:Arabinosyltransferase [Arachis hypogaea]
MIGRREGALMRNNGSHSLWKSKVVTAVAIGVLIGCVFAFLFPNGFFYSVPTSTPNRHLSLAGSKTQFLCSDLTVTSIVIVGICLTL